MPKTSPLTLEAVSNALSYDPETGIFRWLVNAARNVKAGDVAGCVKGLRLNKRTGKQTRYMYIRFDNIETPAARIAWLLHYGVYPEGNVLFVDGDTINLKISNLRESSAMKTVTNKAGIKSRKMTTEATRHYGLKRYYGMTGEQYGQMLADQCGLCAICKRPETAMANGKPKVMHVDHCHKTGVVRALLCNNCNPMLGHAKDDIETLRAAADYIEHHTSKIVSLTGAQNGVLQ